MASGYYPLDSVHHKGGKLLAEMASELKSMLDNRGEYGPLPASWDGNTPEDAAYDGIHEAYLYLAHELIERCIKRPAQEPANA